MRYRLEVPRQVARRLALAALLISLVAACDDDDKKTNSLVPDLSGDASAADATNLDVSRPDATTTSTPDATTQIDTRTNPDTSVVDTTPDIIVDPGGDDFACNLADRVAACESAILMDGSPMPTDPSDYLFYVNRTYPIPSDYPISSTSTWIPCDGGDPGVSHDLVCVPPQYSTRALAMRQAAWESDAPAAPSTTFDGLTVGHNGKVGYAAMFEAANAEAGFDLFIASGFRSFAVQQATFNGHVNREVSNGLTLDQATLEASTYSAQPGHSEHQLGTTADLTYRTPSGNIYPGLNQAMGDSAAFAWVHANSHRFGIVLTYDKDKIPVTQYVYEPWHHRFVGVEAADDMRNCLLNTEEFLAARYGVGALPAYAGDPLILRHDADLLSHLTLPPGGWMMPNTQETKSWRVHNNGTINWHQYDVVRVSGDSLGNDTTVSCVRVDEAVDIAMDIQAPSAPGTYEATYRLRDPGGNLFGDELLVRIVVSDQPPAADPYYYVRVDDLSNATGGADPGADIDAVVLDKAGSRYYAESVSSYEATPAAVSKNDPMQILGEPDAFHSYPNTTVCDVNAGFVSLGGGGTIVVRMGAEIEMGDQVQVLEIGGCSYGGGTAISDRVEVLVSVADDVAGNWVALGTGTGPSIALTVPELPAATAP